MLQPALSCRTTVHGRGCQHISVRIVAFRDDPGATRARRIAVGDALPFDTCLTVFKKGATEPEPMKLGQIFRAKRALVVGLPGAYACSFCDKHVAQFLSKRSELKPLGVDMLACASVNDAYVLREWAEDLGINTEEVCLLADQDASFHNAIGLTEVVPGQGERALPYHMFIDDGVVKLLHVDEPDSMVHRTEGCERTLEKLKEHVHQSRDEGHRSLDAIWADLRHQQTQQQHEQQR